MVYDLTSSERMSAKLGAEPVMAPHEVALESFDYWTHSKFRKYNRMSAIGMMAMEAGETSFRLGVIGDNGHAWGPFQHQWIRREAIKNKTGIDVATASHLDALAATDYEINNIRPYHRIGELLGKMDEPSQVISLLVIKFEQALNPDNRDVRRRVALYNFWDSELKRLGL